jgi:hypothetical protein
VRALYALLEENFTNVDALREELRRIVAPEKPPILSLVEEPPAIIEETVYVPRMD